MAGHAVKLEILSPREGDRFGFNEKILFTATASERTDEGWKPIPEEIRWRNPCKGRGPKFEMTFQDRKNAIIAAHVRGIHRSVTLKIVCKALEREDSLGNKIPYGDDAIWLARIMAAEGMECCLEERKQIGYVILNRRRKGRPDFPPTIADVILQKGQFDGVKNELFAKTDPKNVADELDVRQCRVFEENLKAAEKILRDGESGSEPVFLKYGQHAFYFNRSGDPEKYPREIPSSRASPIATKKDLGWKHSFYNMDPDVDVNSGKDSYLRTLFYNAKSEERAELTRILKRNRPYSDFGDLMEKITKLKNVRKGTRDQLIRLLRKEHGKGRIKF